MESFVISGKAKEIFPLIALKARIEQANKAKEAIENIRVDGLICPYDIFKRCDVPLRYCPGQNCERR